MWCFTCCCHSLCGLLQTGAFLQRSKSFCHAEIEQLLDKVESPNDLIGDFTKVQQKLRPSERSTMTAFSPMPLFSQPFVLPTVEGKHQDLKYITSDMVRRSSVFNAWTM